MRFRKLLIFLSLSAGICQANAAAVPRVTAEALVNGTGSTDDTPFSVAERQYLSGYLAGVADTLEGKLWCDKGRVKTVEIDADVLWALKDMPKEKLHVNAAILVGEVLRRKYPCR